MAASPHKNIICLAVDRLHVGYLGAYGNTWINTPALDRLAAESFVFDRAEIDTPSLDLQYRSLWQGLHAMVPEGTGAKQPSLAERLARGGWKTALLTDDSEVAKHSQAAAFAERVALKPNSGKRTMAEEVEETQAAEFFAAADEWIRNAAAPFLLWLHTGTLGTIWDAPLEFREQYRDEDDPPARSSTEVPNIILPEQFDPDELLAITHAYAGQVTALDRLIGLLVDSIEDAGIASETLLILYSPRGFPLGEHRRVGAGDDALYSELTHVPVMLRFPDDRGCADRSTALVQPADLPATILDWTGLETPDTEAPLAGHGRSVMPLIAGQSATGLDRACIVAANQQGIVTPAWSLRLSHRGAAGDETPSVAELFAKPDDMFEVNEVSNRCTDVVEELQSALGEFAAACQAGAPATLAPLPEELIHGVE